MGEAVARWLEGIWYHGRRGAALLVPLSWLFAALAALRRAGFRLGLLSVYRPRIPVVVIGNLSVGGTGKSPLVGMLASLLRQRGLRPAILTRGYGAPVAVPTLVTRDTDPAQVGDEPVMLAVNTGVPVMVSPDRAAGARALEASGADIILCDDGLQHYALARDLEIVVIDGERGLGNGRLLPAGPLRESAVRLETVDWVVINGEHSGAAGSPRWRGRRGTFVMQLLPQVARGIADPAAWRSIEDFRGEAVHAVAGIGHPSRFFRTLREAGLEVIEHAFPDHHAFSDADLDFGDSRAVLMTSKDAVKCRGYADARCWEIPVAVRLPLDATTQLVAEIAALVDAQRPETTSKPKG